MRSEPNCPWSAYLDDPGPVEGPGLLLRPSGVYADAGRQFRVYGGDIPEYRPVGHLWIGVGHFWRRECDPKRRVASGDKFSWCAILVDSLEEEEPDCTYTGTSASPFAFVPTERPHNSTWATYTIDGGAPAVNFTLEGLGSSSAATNYNVILFTTPNLPSGSHNLVVTYGGDGNHTPLVIQGFYVTNTTTLATSNGSSSSTSPSSSASPSAPSVPVHHSPAGAIAGGVIGGFVALALLVALVFWLGKRRRRATEDKTAPNPYPMAMANGDAPPVAPPAGGAYGYSSVPPIPSGFADASSSGGGAHSDASRPSTNYPYIHSTAPLHQHPSDAATSRGTGTATHSHSQQPSTSTSYPFSGSTSHSSGAPPPSGSGVGSVSAVGSHGSAHDAQGLPTPQSTPQSAYAVPSKIARERAAAAALTSSAPSTTPSARVVRHEDSGVRLPGAGARASSPMSEIVELPPGYSPD